MARVDVPRFWRMLTSGLILLTQVECGAQSLSAAPFLPLLLLWGGVLGPVGVYLGSAVVHSNCADVSLSVREACGRNKELVLRCTAGCKHAHVNGDEDSLAGAMVLSAFLALFAKRSRLTEVSISLSRGESFQSV